MSRSRILLLTAVGLALAGGGLWLLLGRGPARFRGATGDASVILITLDTVRADHIGAYGHRQIRTPVIDTLADQGVLFENAVTPAVMTLPSHASILTGTWPPTHGIRNNGDYRLGPGALTLAEILRARGFRTGAVVGSFVLDSMFGLDQGFDEYDDTLPSRRPNESFYAERPARAVTDAALRFLGGARSSRFFLWAHYFDAHHPYVAPPEFRDQYPGRPYDAEIAYVDAEIGRLLSSMRSMGLMDRTLVVVVGDHGEGLGDHGEDSHGVFVYEEATRVPLIFSFPPHVPATARPKGVVSTVDIVPTILDLLRIDPEQAAGPVQGRSLWPLMADPETARTAGEAAYAEAMVPLLLYGWSPLASIRDGKYKYIEAPRPELYDLASDPGEKRNLAEAIPVVAAGYRARLEAMRDRITRHGAGAEVLSLDAEAEARLRSLGYAGGGAPPATGAVNLPDPKDMVPMLDRINRVYSLFGSGRHEAAVAEARSILAENPSNSSVRYYYAGSLTQMDRHEEAIREYRVILESSPSNTEVLSNVGWCQMNLERFDEATATFNRVLEIYPDHIYAMASLANIAFVKGEYPEAARLYKQVLQKKPGHLPSILTLAGMYEASGKLDEAAVFYTHAAEVDPSDVDVWMNIAWIRFRQARGDDALAALDRALQITPGAPDLLVAKGDVLLSLERLDEARDAYQGGVNGEPRLAGGHYGLGVVALRTGDGEAAVRRIADALRLRPDKASWLEDLSRALAMTGRYGDAASALERYLASGQAPPERRDALRREIRDLRGRKG